MDFAPFQLAPEYRIQSGGDTGGYAGICLLSEETLLLVRIYGAWTSSVNNY